MEEENPFRNQILSDEATVFETFDEDQSNATSNIRPSLGKSSLKLCESVY